MADLRVTRTAKDEDGDITALCGSGWRREKDDAIRDINTGLNRYYVEWSDVTTWVRVVAGPNGPYLRTDRDATPRNNLDELPDC